MRKKILFFLLSFVYITHAKELTFIDTAYTYLLSGNYRDCISFSSMCKYKLQKSKGIDVDKKIFILNAYMGSSYDNMNMEDSSLILRLENRNLSINSSICSDEEYILNEINISTHYFSSNQKSGLESLDLALARIDKITGKCRWKFSNTCRFFQTECLPLVLIIPYYKSIIYASLGNTKKEAKYMDECMSIANKMEQIDEMAYYFFLNKYRRNLNKRRYSKKSERLLSLITYKCADLLINHLPEKLVKMTASQRNIYLKQVQSDMLDMSRNIEVFQYTLSQFADMGYDLTLWTKNLTIDIKNNITNIVKQSGDSVLQKDIEYLESIKSNLILEDSIINKLKYWEQNVSYRISMIEHPQLNFNYSWKEVQNAMQENEIAIEFFQITNVSHLIFMIKKGWSHPISFYALAFISPENLSTSINKYFKTELIGVDKIYLSLSGNFNKYPVETYWEQKFPNQKVYRVSSTRILCNRNEKIENYNNITLFGGLKYSLTPIKKTEDSIALVRSGVRYLPGTLLEVNKIEELARIYNYWVFKEIDHIGSEYLFRLSKNRKIIHLATHGFYINNIEDLSEKTLLHRYLTKRLNEINYDSYDIALYCSGLLFSGASDALLNENNIEGPFDGILTAKEISNMDLSNTELLVLSACESGLGKIGCDGIWGLPIAFKMAGVKTILFSLWEVDDDATQMLMVEFYKNYFKGMTKKMSLNKAQEYVKSQPGFEDPYYWAGFILLDGLD